MLNVSLEMVARENRMCCKVTNKPPVCRALLLKKIDADSENDMKRTRCIEQKPVGSLRFFHRP